MLSLSSLISRYRVPAIRIFNQTLYFSNSTIASALKLYEYKNRNPYRQSACNRFVLCSKKIPAVSGNLDGLCLLAIHHFYYLPQSFLEPMTHISDTAWFPNTECGSSYQFIFRQARRGKKYNDLNTLEFQKY